MSKKRHSCDGMFFCRDCGQMWCWHDTECGCTADEEDEYDPLIFVE